jgi:drug/metabolite transporter (DMT)-like permease
MQINQVQTSPSKPPIVAYVAIFAMIASVSSAAILIRLALLEAMPPILIAGARLFVATSVLTPIIVSRYRSHIRHITRTELALASISGLFLALHFIAWVSSLQYTTVLVSVVVVQSGPIWVAILEVIFLKIRLSQIVIIGLVIALLGGIFIVIPLQSNAVQVAGEQATTITGALLAWIGALAVSVYMLIGRKLRAKLPIIPYIWLVYGTATIVIMIVIIATATPITGYRSEGYFILLMMGLIPQLIGHSSLNYVLEYFPATLVSMFAQLEPIGGAILALIIFAEIPPTQQIIGSAIIMFGVLLASRGKVSQSGKRNISEN